MAEVNTLTVCSAARDFLPFGSSLTGKRFTPPDAANIFTRYKAGTAYVVNVCDPAKHKASVTDEALTVDADTLTARTAHSALQAGYTVWAARATDWLTRKLTRGQYSHCEIAVKLPAQDIRGAPVYRCYSASVRDGGVRRTDMTLPAAKWDLIELRSTPHLRAGLEVLWQRTQGQGYDFMGALGVVFKTRQRQGCWFCSEWCARVVGLSESWRFSPNDLAAIVPTLFKGEEAQ